MKKYYVVVLVMFAILISCKKVEKKSNDKKNISQELIADNTANDYLIMSTMWFQKSAECRALSYQAYNWATKMLDQHLKNNELSKKPPCVILDIDETVVDNSPFEGKCIKTGKSYTPEFWKEWSNLAQAKAIPGALDFCNYAKSKGVEVFYVSNRSVEELEASIKNVDSLGFPFADEKHFLLKSSESSKKLRRETIAENYNILILLGDNLNDFNEIFENRQNLYGFATVDENRKEFGNRFILLPNPMYGSWEKPIIKNANKKDLSKSEIRKQTVVSY